MSDTPGRADYLAAESIRLLRCGVDSAHPRGGSRGWTDTAARRPRRRRRLGGWAADGRPGFVYTTDWDGSPVVHSLLDRVPPPPEVVA